MKQEAAALQSIAVNAAVSCCENKQYKNADWKYIQKNVEEKT